MAPEVLCRVLDDIDSAGFIPALQVSKKASCAIKQFGRNKKVHLLGEQRGMLLNLNQHNLHERLIHVGQKLATNKSVLSVDQFLHKN